MQFRIYFIVFILLNCLEGLAQGVTRFLKTVFSQSQKLEERKYPFGQIDILIMKECKKQDYQESQEIDGTMSDYSTVIIEFGLVAMFGLSYPLVFILSLASGICQTHLDKFKIFYFSRRPVAKSAKSIGFWNNVLRFIQGASILTNAAIIAFTSNKDYVDESGTFFEQMTEDGRMYLFVGLLIFFFATKIVIGLAY